MILYLEGGNHLRPPVAQFIRRATGPIDLKIQPCGSGDNAIEECAKDGDGLLLIDSEGEDLQQLTQRVASQIGAANRAFFMVQKMEAWFMADRNALRNHFGAGFRESALPPNRNVEEVSIQDIDNALRNATRDCAKQRYRKGRDDAGLLNRLNPATVYNACPNFALLINHLRDQRAR
ncbi:MAG: DUF4276 family protein [Chloroflexota bacterium]|nr:DUF4276 family protein [Chloroflexota bacterium]MDE2958495.1 DUF4276 family protein [Chloroflexota bacterium]